MKTLDKIRNFGVSSCDSCDRSRGCIVFNRVKFIEARGLTFVCAFIIAAFSLVSCKLHYTGEEFGLSISEDGSGALTVYFSEISSEETLAHLRGNDLQFAKDLAQDPAYVAKAADSGVSIKSRRLDFVDYSINGHVVASAKNYADLFKVFTNYELELDDRIYIIPLNATVARATLSEGGEIVVRNKKYAFAWPRDAKAISFKATYKATGTKFTYSNDGR